MQYVWRCGDDRRLLTVDHPFSYIDINSSPVNHRITVGCNSETCCRFCLLQWTNSRWPSASHHSGFCSTTFHFQVPSVYSSWYFHTSSEILTLHCIPKLKFCWGDHTVIPYYKATKKTITSKVAEHKDHAFEVWLVNANRIKILLFIPLLSVN